MIKILALHGKSNTRKYLPLLTSKTRSKAQT
jgi:hypothetical protein